MGPSVGPTSGVVSATVLVLWWQGIKKHEIGVICSGIYTTCNENRSEIMMIHMPMYVYDGSVNLFCSVDCVHPLFSLFCIVFFFIFHVFSSSLPVHLRDCDIELD